MAHTQTPTPSAAIPMHASTATPTGSTEIPSIVLEGNSTEQMVLIIVRIIGLLIVIISKIWK